MRKVIRLLAVTTLALTLALPFTAYAGTWQQDTAGWRVQSDNGTYLTNQWYQSPESKLWYYIGENGYMLTNTYTPDGYFVNADGVWVQSVPQESVQSEPVVNEPQVQSTQPEVQPTQSNNNGEIDTSGWDLGGGSVKEKPLDEEQNLTPGEIADIESVDFN